MITHVDCQLHDTTFLCEHHYKIQIRLCLQVSWSLVRWLVALLSQSHAPEQMKKMEIILDNSLFTGRQTYNLSIQPEFLLYLPGLVIPTVFPSMCTAPNYRTCVIRIFFCISNLLYFVEPFTIQLSQGSLNQIPRILSSCKVDKHRTSYDLVSQYGNH